MEIHAFKKIYSNSLNKEYIKINIEKINLKLRLNEIEGIMLAMPKAPEQISEWIDSLPEVHHERKSFSLANYKKLLSFRKEVAKIDAKVAEIDCRIKMIEIEDLIERAKILSEG